MKRNKLSYTSKEANRMAWLISILVFVIGNFILSQIGKFDYVVLARVAGISIFVYWILRIVFRVDKRKELEIKERVKNSLDNQRKPVEYNWIDFEDEEWGDLIEEIIENKDFNFYAHIERGGVILEVREGKKDEKLICQSPVSWRFFDEYFILK